MRPLAVPVDIQNLLRELAPQVLGALIRTTGDFDASEDAVQEALLAAALHWPRDGVPANPRGWLAQTALRRFIDARRSDRSRHQREVVAAQQSELPLEVVDDDDTLNLLFACCHPSLTPTSAIALTLRAVGGLTTAEVASAFVVSESTMAQRISRSKQRIKTSGVKFGTAASENPRAGLRTVLRVLYLMFNEGYASSTGNRLHRVELSSEAIRLTRMLQRLQRDDGEITALLALMLLIDARRPARTDDAGEPIPLAKQDRTLWDRALISEGVRLVDTVIRQPPVGEYHVEAAIAAVHDQAPRAEQTDWPQILGLYDLLERITPNPVVTLNKAVAVAMVYGPESGLDLVDAAQSQLSGHYRVDAVRAYLLELMGDPLGAARHYAAAASRTTNLIERRYLVRQAARLRGHCHHDAALQVRPAACAARSTCSR
jgi:RNA polymerase sigma factor (sigma-70 family)